jgi:cytochrome P450
MTVALEEWLKRFPEFEAVPNKPVVWSEGQLRGPIEVWVRIGTGY